jgi:peptidoglycan hydrolase-like protein with peptidoglycan-binding domain
VKLFEARPPNRGPGACRQRLIRCRQISTRKRDPANIRNIGETQAQLKLKMSKKFAKIGTFAVAATFALSLSVNSVGAVTVAELQAQINALMAQLASLQGGASVGAQITSDLTVGSTGSQVVALQSALVSQGHLVMPAGVAMGYFGSLTKAAVMRWQAANGVPATGYFGPISRAKFNGSAGATGTVPGTTIGGGTTVGGSITTPGVEGTLTAELSSSPAAGQTVREGDEKKGILGIELEADLSDIKIERIKIKLDQASGGTADRDLYRDIADRLYVMSGSTVLASVELNSDTVIEETTGNYYVTITGLNFVVPKDTEKVLTIAIDAQDSFDSEFEGDTWTLTIPAEGVRGVDGAGINQYAPSSGTLARTFTTQADQAEDATLAISLSASTPQAKEVVAAAGSDEDELDGLELLKFDARAEDDDVTITDVVIDFVRGGTTSTATATTAYLYDESGALVGSASVVGTSLTAMTATFDDIDVVVDENDSETFTVKVDIDDAGTAATTFVASLDAEDVTAENSDEDAITETGSADGETITVRKVGLEVSLVSKSITKGLTPESGSQSTSTAEAKFTIRVKAVGGDIIFGDSGTSTTAGVPFVSNAGGAHDENPSFVIYRGGAEVALDVASSTSITVPSGVSNVTANSFTLQENNTVDIEVSFVFEGRDDDSGAAITTGSYAVGIQQLNWISSAGIQESNFMDDETSWRTSTVTLP